MINYNKLVLVVNKCVVFLKTGTHMLIAFRAVSTNFSILSSLGGIQDTRVYNTPLLPAG